MRTLYTLIFIVSTISFTQAQKDAPSWLDPYQRQAKYPASSYLTGLSSELVPKNASLSNIYGQLNQLSRNQIIEAIRVEVKAETEMNISIVNTEATQLLDQRSASASEAELVGLKFENYYDKKKKLAYSFSYVSISELIQFHQDIISASTSDIDKNINETTNALQAENKQQAIDLIYNSQSQLNKINESALVLLALGQDDLLDFAKIREMKKAVEAATDKVFTSGKLSVNELASYVAYQIQLQLDDEPATVAAGAMQYTNSNKESDFSIELRKKSMNTLVELGTLKRADENAIYNYNGTFSNANGLISVSGNLVNQAGKAVAGISVKVSDQILALGELSFLPKNFEFIDDLSSIKILTPIKNYSIKKVDLFDYPITMEVQLEAQPLEDIPINFVITEDGQIVVNKTIATDKYGKVSLLLNTEELKHSGEFVLTSVIDVTALLDVSTNSPFYRKVIQDQPPYQIESKIAILAPTVYVQSTELSLGQPRNILILAPSIKKELATLDYKFIDSANEADYLVEIKSATREGQNSGVAHFSYLDATVSMQETKSGKELYKYSVSDVKGAGANFSVADAKAYEKAKKIIASDLSYKLEFGDR